MHLLKIKIKEDFRCLLKDTEIELKPLTLLVGEQGCGKSSLLDLLQDNKTGVEVSELVKNIGIPSYYFDSEKMNPRMKDPQLFTTVSGADIGIGLGGAIASRFKSHGEILREFTVNRIKDASDCVLLLDEPEAALSLKNQYKLANEINISVNRHVQVIAATHCLLLIESVENVFNMETMEWVSSKEFINQSKQ